MRQIIQSIQNYFCHRSWYVIRIFVNSGSVVITSLTCPSYIAHTSNLFPATSCGTSLSLQFAAWCCMYYHLRRQQVFMLQKVHVTSTKKLLREREVSGKMLLVLHGVLVKISMPLLSFRLKWTVQRTRFHFL